MKQLTRLKTAVLSAAAAAIVCCGLLTASAGAAGVVNGGFESGDLAGWTSYSATGEGVWAAYEKEPGQGILAPPSGNWAAATEEGDPDTLILYQDVALPPSATSTLTMTLYYGSSEPIAIPTPNTLSVEPTGPEFSNQQYRVDVVKPTAPIESLSPADILAPVFATKVGDPEEMGPVVLSTDLTPFAGQTVRLRLANAVFDGPFNAAVDNVAITSTPINTISSPPINTFTQGKLKSGNGSATLEVTVPGPGTISLVSLGKKGKPKPIKAATRTVGIARTIKLPLKATGTGRKTLKKKGKLPFKVQISFTPTGGTATVQTRSGKLKLKPKPKKR